MLISNKFGVLSLTSRAFKRSETDPVNTHIDKISNPFTLRGWGPLRLFSSGGGLCFLLLMKKG